MCMFLYDLNFISFFNLVAFYYIGLISSLCFRQIERACHFVFLSCCAYVSIAVVNANSKNAIACSRETEGKPSRKS